MVFRLFNFFVVLFVMTYLVSTTYASRGINLGGLGKKAIKKSVLGSGSGDFESTQQNIVMRMSESMNLVARAVEILADVYEIKELAREKYVQARELDPAKQGEIKARMGATAEALSAIEKAQSEGGTLDKGARRKARRARGFLMRGTILGYSVGKDIPGAVRGLRKELRGGGLMGGGQNALQQAGEMKKKFGTILLLGKNYPPFIQTVVTTSRKIDQNLKKAGVDDTSRKSRKLDEQMKDMEF
jgi:hypothetical protein